jgi:hypothetical protein
MKRITHESEKMCPAFILRLLLEDSASVEKPDEVSWEDLLRVARRNTVLVRLSGKLQQKGVRPPGFFNAAVEEQRRLNLEKLDLIKRLNRSCEENGVAFLFAKAFHHYPDMGGDVDLFVLSNSAEVDALALKGLSAEPCKRLLIDRLASTVCYKVRGYGAKLDIHHGRMWVYGEHNSFITALINNARRIEIEGTEFSIPSAEDLLIMQATQRVYGRSYIRLAPVLYTINALRHDNVDWNYLLRAARRFNALLGLSCYLTYVNQIHQEVFGSDLLPAEVRKSLVKKEWGRVEFRDGAYRFHHLRVARKVYLNMFRGALVSGNWKSLSRLCLAPFVAASVVLRKSVNQ